MRGYSDYLRWLYQGRRPNAWARLQNRASAVVFGAGIWPSRAAALQVRGRRSGREISFPVVITEHEGQRYLVAMLGERANWVRNVRAAGGRAILRHGKKEVVRLEEVPVDRRPAILRQYLAVAPVRPPAHPGRPKRPSFRLCPPRPRDPGGSHQDGSTTRHKYSRSSRSTMILAHDPPRADPLSRHRRNQPPPSTEFS
jgi:F420H(2)-dependent quinone reductase